MLSRTAHEDSGVEGTSGSCQSVLLAEIAALKPTQIAVGYREVCIKLQNLHACGSDSGEVAQKRHIPVIMGPGGHLYVHDGHHLALALHLAGRVAVSVCIIADLRNLSTPAFWNVLEERRWVYPFDGSGRKRRYREMPSSILWVDDDPFRSLARALRRCGGFAKTAIPYADFTWASFLRCRISQTQLRDFPTALASARDLAASHEASHLPGWLIPSASQRSAPASAHLP